MRYGYFDDENFEYVITDPHTPVKWINYVGTLSFGGFVDHTGGMLICKKDPALNRITKYIPQMPVGDFKGATVYLRLKEGSGKISVNGKGLQEYLKRDSLALLVKQPLEATNTAAKFDVKANVRGGGLSGQAGALQLGIARAILIQDESYKKVLKAGGFLTRDPREKERKKYGQPGARKKFQFSKR